MYVSGSADLHGSNKNYIDNGGDFGVNFGKRCVLFVCRLIPVFGSRSHCLFVSVYGQ